MTNFVITLKWLLLVITLTQARADDTRGIERRATNVESKKIVCYYTNWSVYRPGTAKFTPQNINPYLCTHLIYAFGGLDSDKNGLRPYDKYQDIEQGGYAKFTGLKTYNKNLKTMLAIGGWNEGSSRFSNLVADDERRTQFVKNVVKFLRQNNFDGLDLDWEYPAFRDGSKAADRENYAALVKELREEFERESSKTGRPRLLLTMAVPAGIEYIDKGYDVPKLNRYLDFMNILSYDYHSAYEPNVNHHSPLYPLQEESEYNFDFQLTIDYTIKHYLKKGADPEKLVLGIPTYGRSYTLFNPDSTDLGSPSDGPGEQGEATREKGYLAYYEICGNVGKSDEWKIVQPKSSAMGPFAYRGTQWVGYDDTDIVKLKAQFANEKGLGGIMYWSIDNDDFRGKCHGKPFPLIEAGKEALLTSKGNSPNAVFVSSEEKRTKLGGRKHRPKHPSTSPKSVSSTSRTTTTSTTTFNPLSTPEPPTTPDPGTDFVCKEEGFFPHPRDCKKYFWCLDSGPSNLGIVGHQFTCPSGLLFNKAADSCDYSRNVICNKKSEKSTTSTTTTRGTTTASSVTKQGTTPSTTTTTTTTESVAEEEYEEEEEDADSQEDPKAIKQLITLIKKLGGISELEKQLKIDDSSKEATTPAISKTLYNKVLTNSRFRNQQRNGPSGPQNEGLSSSDDVPYNKKDKPHYVTIQRSRPLKNDAQDIENSGTTNSKSVQANKDDEEVDYADAAGVEEEVTSPRYSSSPRSRTNADRTNSLKYVVLERNRADRTTTESEELAPQSPPSSTHRYVTLVRHRPSTTSNETEDQSSSTETIIRTTSKPSSRIDKEEPVSEKIREKVSEFESTTYPPTLPVTSAQYVTTTTPVANSNASERSNADVNTNNPNTFLVYPQKADDYGNHYPVYNRTESTTLALEVERSTESFTTSIATTIITTVRESPTEKTRIPLRMYREWYFQKNRTDTSRHDLLSNSVGGGKKTKEGGGSTEESSTKKPSFHRRRPQTVLAKSSNNTEHTTGHSRPFLRRHKLNSTTADTFGKESTTLGSDISEESVATKQKHSRFRSRYETPATESNAGIANFFKHRRLSSTTTTTESSEENASSTTNPFTRVSSRYFSRNRKTSPAEGVLPTESAPVTTSRGKFVRDRYHHGRGTTKSEILDSDENNRYARIHSSTAQSVTDQISLSNSNEQSELSGKNRSPVYVEPTTMPGETNETLEEMTTSSYIAESTSEEINRANTTSRPHHWVHTSTPKSERIFFNTSSEHPRFWVYSSTPIRLDDDFETTIQPLHHRIPSSSPKFDGSFVISSEHPHHWIHPASTSRSDRIYDLSSEHPRNRIVSSTVKSENAIFSRINHRNNSRFLKNPELELSPHIRKKETTVHGYPSRSEPTKTESSTSPVNVVQNTNESQTEFEVQIKHVPQQKTSWSKNDWEQPKGRSLNVNSDAETPTVSRSRGRHRFSDDAVDKKTSDVAFVEINRKPSAIDNFASRSGGSQEQYSSLNNKVTSKLEATTKRAVSRNRGSVKARNSLSKAEIKELANLVDTSTSTKYHSRKHHHHHVPINRIEETSSNSGYEGSREDGLPRTSFNSPRNLNNDDETYPWNVNAFSYSTVYPNPNDRIFEETTDSTDSFYVLGENTILTEPPSADSKVNDVFRVSETKYGDEDIRQNDSGYERRSENPRNVLDKTLEGQETPSRLRGNNFRRYNPSYHSRSRFSSSTTTSTTTEYTPVESNKLASRFRRRKGRPENRSINTARSENFIPLTEPETSTVTMRYKNNDISQRGSTQISDYLPVPAPLYRLNQTNFDPLNAENINLEDVEAQTISTATDYNTNDVSDLANPAVAAISNLKTIPPVTSSHSVFTKTVAPVPPQITYRKEIPLGQFHVVKSTPSSKIGVPVYQHPSHRRGVTRLSSRTTTTTQLPSLQDIYNDYQDTESDYHAEPVDIPITGKVRIHSDGYIECLDMGNFPHPFSCKKFISCAKMDYDSLLGWEYTCPKGLSFDPIGGICNWAAGLGCKE